MPYHPDIHHRKSIRLQGYDYSKVGLYFITICCQNRMCLFGKIINTEDQNQMILNDAGKMIENWFQKLPDKFTNIKCHQFIIMPDHFHGILEIQKNVGADPRVCPANTQRLNIKGEHMGSPLQTVIQWFKIMTTNKYIHGVKQFGWQPFEGKLWQRNYYEHVIRNEEDYQNISNYIIDNPHNWEESDIYAYP